MHNFARKIQSILAEVYFTVFICIFAHAKIAIRLLACYAISLVREWLLENQDNYFYGIPKTVSEPPWIFVVNLSDKAKEVTLSAIDKGLRLEKFKIYEKIQDLLSEYHGRVSFAKCLVFVSEEPPSEDFPLFAVDFFRGNPCLWINSLDETDISKRRFWNLLKELNRYAS